MDRPGSIKREQSASVAARILARLNRFFPRAPRPLYFDVDAYQRWLENSGQDLYDHFYSRYADFGGKSILDLGCGYGGKIITYGRHGASLLCGIDFNQVVLRKAKSHVGRTGLSAQFVGANATTLPFPDSTFDVVISDDGFDHFKRPRAVLDEIRRILRPGGIGLVSFVPYRSTECSHMAEYLRLPWHHLLFSRRAIRQALDLVAAYDRSKSSDQASQRSDVAGVFATFENQLSRLTMKQFKQKLLGLAGVRLVRLRKQSRNWARPLTYLPGINEFFTDCVYCVLTKEESQRIGRLDLIRQLGLDLVQDTRAIAKRMRIVLRST